MKPFLTLILLGFALISVAQAQTTKAIKIDEITKSVIYFNGKTTVGTIILTQAPNPHLTLNPIQQIRDSIYTTIFTFNNPKHLEINDLDLEVNFDKPIISADFNAGNEYYVQWGYNSDKTLYSHKAQKVMSTTIIQLVVKSKEPIVATIHGLDFAFSQ
jgi:hypothetical protein